LPGENRKEIIMDKKINILGFTGSLRKGSYNKAALRAAKELMPEGSALDIIDLAGIPFFNEDVEAEGIPEAVADFKNKIAAADGLLIVTPEYNYSIPPVLKNALDWASRGKDSPLNGKHAAIMSASTGMFGGARSQYHLRQVCVMVNILLFNKPEVFIPKAKEKFDVNGKLTDEYSIDSISKLLKALVDEVK